MKGAFCGSFDPVTIGHLNLIERASRLCDHLTVFVSPNSSKNDAYPVAKRLAWLQEATKDLPNVDCRIQNGLVVDACREVGASILIRGIRNITDFGYEQNMAEMNHYLDSDIETICLMARAEYEFYSSSNVRELLKYHQNIDKFVPACVLRDLKES